jgi:hypothetical protein
MDRALPIVEAAAPSAATSPPPANPLPDPVGRRPRSRRVLGVILAILAATAIIVELVSTN